MLGDHAGSTATRTVMLAGTRERGTRTRNYICAVFTLYIIVRAGRRCHRRSSSRFIYCDYVESPSRHGTMHCASGPSVSGRPLSSGSAFRYYYYTTLLLRIYCARRRLLQYASCAAADYGHPSSYLAVQVGTTRSPRAHTWRTRRVTASPRRSFSIAPRARAGPPSDDGSWGTTYQNGFRNAQGTHCLGAPRRCSKESSLTVRTSACWRTVTCVLSSFSPALSTLSLYSPGDGSSRSMIT